MKDVSATDAVVTNSDAENGNTDPIRQEVNDDVAAEEPDAPEEEEEPVVEKPVRVYKYKEGQWAPHNVTGAKSYDREFLLQFMDDPQSHVKPDNIPSAVMKFERTEGSFSLDAIARPSNSVSFLPTFVKNTMSPKRPARDVGPMKKSTSMVSKPAGMTRGPPPASGPGNKNVIRVTLSLREDVKLNEAENAWKPRVKKEITNSQFMDADQETQDLYKKFRGILNKLTPQKFDKLLDQVKTLPINTQSRLKGVIDLVFEKAIEEPAFSEAYAAMCHRLSKLEVPSDNSPDQLVNFRVMLINKCQALFETTKTHEEVVRLEKELEDCTEPAKKKELSHMLSEEHRKIRMRAVGNIRFIGELYKLKMLIPKIMVHCMDHLIDKYEEEKLEGLCKLLSTIGEQVEAEAKPKVDEIFKKLQNIVTRKIPNKISSRVRFMLQDTIDLRNRRWAKKSVLGAGPKTLDQIQKESDQQHRDIEIMNSGPISSRRGDDRGGKRSGDVRRGGPQNYYNENNFSQIQTKTKYVVDTSKLKAVGNNSNKSLTNVKLGPPSMWNFGSSTKSNQAANPSPPAPVITNMFSVLDTATEPPSFGGATERTSGYQAKGASMEKVNSSRAEISGIRSASVEGTRPDSAEQKVVPTAAVERVESSQPADSISPAEQLSEADKRFVKAAIDQTLLNPNEEEFILEIQKKFRPQYHAAVVTQILNDAFDKPPKTYQQISKTLLHLVSTNTISAGNFIIGMAEILEFAPDLIIDIPKLYDYLAMFVAPHIVNKHISLGQVLKVSEKIVEDNQGGLFLGAIIEELKTAMGPSFAKAKWLESGLEFKQWMNEEDVLKFKNKHEYLDGDDTLAEVPAVEIKKLSPQEVTKTLLHLMRTDQSVDIIKGWVKDNVGNASSEDWFMRVLIQAICTHALFSASGESAVPRFDQDCMNKYIHLINEFGESRETREANCLYGIQQLVHRLEHPRGVTLDIFQYLSDNYIIQREAFLAFETSEQEPEGKAVLLKALVSFYTDIKEADNDDSGSED